MRINQTYSCFLMLVCFLFLVGCGGENNEKQRMGDDQASKKGAVERKFDEVMGVHDPLMERMNELASLRKKLEKKEKELLKDSIKNVVELQDVKRLKDNLKAGHDAMMDWMHQFEKPGEEVPKDSALEYLKLQQHKIDSVERVMESALREAEEEL